MNMPQIGQTVLVTGINHNGRKTHPAMVTSVDEDKQTVNVQIFPDGAAAYARTDIRFTDGLFSESAATQADPIAHSFTLNGAGKDEVKTLKSAPKSAKKE